MTITLDKQYDTTEPMLSKNHWLVFEDYAMETSVLLNKKELNDLVSIVINYLLDLHMQEWETMDNQNGVI